MDKYNLKDPKAYCLFCLLGPQQFKMYTIALVYLQQLFYPLPSSYVRKGTYAGGGKGGKEKSQKERNFVPSHPKQAHAL